MISSISGTHSTWFSRGIVLTWLSTLVTPVMLLVFPMKPSYLYIFFTVSVIFGGIGAIGLNMDMIQLKYESDWTPTKLYYLGILPSPTSFFILGFYLGYRDKAYGVFEQATSNSSEKTHGQTSTEDEIET